MKRLIIRAFFTTVFATLSSLMVLAQESTSPYTTLQSFKFDKKLSPDDIPSLLQVFLEGNGFSLNEESGAFTKTFPSFFYIRKSNTKDILSASLCLSYDISDRQLNLKFKYDVLRNRVLCDRTQTTSEDVLSVQELPEESRTKLDEISHTYSDSIKEYLKRKSFFKIEDVFIKVPIWITLPYIVERSAVSYYNVLQSEKGLSKEQLYHIAENYFTYSYHNGKAVIQTKDPENCVIVGKATLPDVHVYYGFGGTERYTVPFIIRIECRDGRARAIVTVSDYDIHHVGGTMVPGYDFKRNIAEYIPFGAKDDIEMVECIDKLEPIILAIFLEIQKAIDEGNTAVDTLDDW